MPLELVNHPNGQTARMIFVPETCSQNPLTEDEDLILALGKRVAELEAGLRQITHLAKHAPGCGQASTLQLIEKFADKALAG